MSSEVLYFEFFEAFEKAETRADKVEMLRKYANNRFIDFLAGAFDPNIEFDVEIPNYKPSLDPAGLTMTNLEMEVPKLYRFVKNHPMRPSGLTAKRQTELLLVILESMHHKDSELLVGMLKKKLPIKGLTSKLVNEAFPQIYVGD